MNLFDQYKEWMGVGTMDDSFRGGLCNNVLPRYLSDLMLFEPTRDDEDEINGYSSYWGYGSWEIDFNKRAYLFTPLRQTIVLFICAMNDEI